MFERNNQLFAASLILRSYWLLLSPILLCVSLSSRSARGSRLTHRQAQHNTQSLHLVMQNWRILVQTQHLTLALSALLISPFHLHRPLLLLCYHPNLLPLPPLFLSLLPQLSFSVLEWCLLVTVVQPMKTHHFAANQFHPPPIKAIKVLRPPKFSNAFLHSTK